MRALSTDIRKHALQYSAFGRLAPVSHSRPAGVLGFCRLFFVYREGGVGFAGNRTRVSPVAGQGLSLCPEIVVQKKTKTQFVAAVADRDRVGGSG